MFALIFRLSVILSNAFIVMILLLTLVIYNMIVYIQHIILVIILISIDFFIIHIYSAEF